MEKPGTLIQTKQDLLNLVHLGLQSDAIALDTEFVWERTYYPQLGLIQMALSNEDCFLIDPLAIGDLSALGKLLSHRGVVKIFHDAPQDLCILHRVTGAIPQNIFDTRLAAGFADLQATLSLSSLVKELLEIELSKEETRTNWLNRPLSHEQVEYGLNDVRYLRAVRVLLLSRIIGPKIKSWLQEELNLLNNPASYNCENKGNRYKKIRGYGNLDRQGMAILKNLTTWREGMAKKKNRPRGHIVKDVILLNLAKDKLSSPDMIKQKSGISEKGFTRYSETISAIINTTMAQRSTSYPEAKQNIRLNQKEKESYDRLNKMIALKCDVLGIDPALLGNTSELKLLVKTFQGKKMNKAKHLRQTAGWRKSFLEDFFRKDS